MNVVTVVTAVVAVSAVWVYFDATQHRIGKVERGDNSAGAWAAGTMLLWVVVFPLYLVRRGKLIAKAAQRPVDPPARAATLAGLVLVGAGMVYVTADAASLPSCDSPSVTNLASSLVAQNIPGATLDSYGEVAAESTSQRRVCRARLAASDGEVWRVFTVEPHSAGQIFITFR
jgi:hypothetical protein